MASEPGHGEEFVPLETTPQGTQEEGVEYGHEEKDIDLRATLGWFAALGVTVVTVVVLLWGVFELWLHQTPKEELPPSPVFAQGTRYPAPYILPNPPQPGSESLADALSHSPEALTAERKAESDAAKQYGLQDASGNPTIPAGVRDRVLDQLKGPAPAGTAPPEAVATTIGTAQALPSRASGGTRMENGLQ